MTTTTTTMLKQLLAKVGDHAAYLAGRWSDEHEYEPWADYVESMKKALGDEIHLLSSGSTTKGIHFRFHYHGSTQVIILRATPNGRVTVSEVEPKPADLLGMQANNRKPKPKSEPKPKPKPKPKSEPKPKPKSEPKPKPEPKPEPKSEPKPEPKSEPKPKKQRGLGVGALCRELIAKGKTNQEVLAAVQAKFPEAKTSANSVAWYRHQMKELGQL